MRSAWSDVVALPTPAARQLRLNRMRRAKPSGIVIRGKSINLSDISNLNLAGIRFVRCRFSGFGCDIQFGPMSECDLRTCVLDDCRFVAAGDSNFSDAIVERTSFDGPIHDCSFRQAILDGSTFRERPQTRKDWCITADFSGALMKHADCAGAAFSFSRFDRCTIEHSRLSRSQWNRCRTRFLRLHSVNLLGVRVTPKPKPSQLLHQWVDESNGMQKSLSERVAAMTKLRATLSTIAQGFAPATLTCSSVLMSPYGCGSERLLAVFSGAATRIHAFRASSQKHLRIYGFGYGASSIPPDHAIQYDFAGWSPIVAHARCSSTASPVKDRRVKRSLREADTHWKAWLETLATGKSPVRRSSSVKTTSDPE